MLFVSSCAFESSGKFIWYCCPMLTAWYVVRRRPLYRMAGCCFVDRGAISVQSSVQFVAHVIRKFQPRL